MKTLKKLKKKFIIIFWIAVLILSYLGASQYLNSDKLPLEEEITRFLNTLTYSSLDDLGRDETRISLNFANNTWTINNIFAYDEVGKIVNQGTRSGVCTQLSQITFGYLQSLLGEYYDIVFLQANEARFFSSSDNAGTTHFLLKATPKSNTKKLGKPLIVDPTFKVYNYIDRIENLEFSKDLANFSVFKNKTTDMSMFIDMQYPLTFSKDKKHLLSLVIKRVNNRYNKDNFALLIYATKEYSIRGHCIFGLINNNGKLEAFKLDPMLIKFLSKQDIVRIAAITNRLFSTIVFQ